MKRSPCLLLALAFACAGAALLSAQVPAAPSAKRALALDDLLNWQGIAGTALSRQGDWFAYRQSGATGDGDAVFRQVHGDKLYRFNLGEQPEAGGRGGAGGGRGGRGGPAAFTNLALSSDAHYGAFLAYPTHAEAAQLLRAHKPIETHAVIVDLADGSKVEIPRIRRFAFSGDNPGWIALQKLPPAPAAGAGGRGGRGAVANAPADEAAPAPEPVGTDLLLRDLATGQQMDIGSVTDFAFNRPGNRLAWSVSSEDGTGNSVEYRILATGAVHSLDSEAQADYRGLNWNPKGTALAVLKGTEDKRYADRVYAVLGFRDFTAPAPLRVAFDPASDATFPAGFGISPDRNPDWSESQDALFFGIHALKPAPPSARRGAAPEAAAASAADAVDLVLWNYKDPRLQSEQIVEESRDSDYSYLAEYRPAAGKFFRLADDTVRQVTPAPHDRYALGVAATPYELAGHLDGQTYSDIYATDLATGARTLALKHARWPAEVSPDGTHFAYYQDGNYYAYDMATGHSANLTAGVAASFINTEDDHNLDRPPVAAVGWSRDGSDLLLSDNWDIWKVPVSGAPAVNLTVNGKRDGIRYRRPVNFDLATDPDARGYDLSRPLYLDAYGEWTKKDGIAVLTPGQPGARIVSFDQAGYGSLEKAADAPVYLYTRQTYVDPPDYYSTDAAFAPGVKLTDLGTQQKPFLWTSGTILVNYIGAKGDRLQGALHLPPNYVKGQQYPTIVEFYEKMSQNAYTYIRPALSSAGFNIADYLSNGYAVFDPDISFKVDDPGISSTACLEAAVKAAIATGVVDPKHLGIHGHSWGGYQTAFVITQSHLFTAAVAGAPLTDMISMYGLIYKNSGETNGQIFEASQGRFTGPPWDLWAVYTRNSPVANVKNVTTPLLMLSDYSDGAVDFTQGIEYFDALRREGKPVVLLDYPSQNHTLAKRADQKDYTVRMMQFYNHYLKGAPMPAWYANGVPALNMANYLKTFQKKYEK